MPMIRSLAVLVTAVCAARPLAAQQPADTSLYVRLGGVPAIALVVDYFVDRLEWNPVIRANPAVRLAFADPIKPGLKYRLTELVCFGGRARLFPVDDLPESRQVRLDRLYPGAIWKQPERTVLVPLPSEGTSLPTWLCELLTGVLEAPPAPRLPDTERPEQRRAAS